ncbi:MAG: MlaD family protein [Pseudomonadota bacterium]
METRAHYILIGAFMLGGILLTLIFTLWLGSVEREYDEYEVVFRQKISGLEAGANVLFNGIKVGEVDELRLDPNDPNQSLAKVRVQKGTPVKTDTRVELELVGVTGLAVIQFNGGSRNAPMLLAASDERVPQIAADLSGIAAVLDSSGDIVLNIQRLLNQENAEAISRIVADVESITDIISDKEADIGLIIDNLAVTSGSLRRSVEGLENAMGSVEATADRVRLLVDEEGVKTLEEFAAAAEGVNKLVADIDQIIVDNKPAIDAFAQQGLGSAMIMLARMNRLVSTTEAILLEFDRDPARFLIGEGRPTAE